MRAIAGAAFEVLRELASAVLGSPSPGTGPLVVGVAAGLLVLAVAGWRLRRWWRTRRQIRRSRRRHDRARERPPPVDVGDVATLGVTEFSRHHSGERHAVGKVEGFVVFVEDVPGSVDVADVIRVKILSFNRGGTSATATYLGRA